MTVDVPKDQSDILVIDDLTRYNAFKNPTKKILAYPSSPSNGIDYTDYTFKDLDTFAYVAATEYAKTAPPRSSSAQMNDVVALLGSSDIDYVITTLALAKLGHSVLFLSSRISHAAYISLLRETSCNIMLVGNGFREKANGLLNELPDLHILSILGPDVYGKRGFSEPANTRMTHSLDRSIESDRICWIIHSSGSTGLPKSIRQTNQAALRNYANNLNMRGLITLPLFHAHGISSVFRAFYSGKQIHMYSASLPLTSANISSVMRAYDFEVLYGVPYALKLLSETADGIALLRKLKLVMFGGSSCPDILGDFLVKNGVYIVAHYGTTETGQLMTSERDRKNDLDWNYLRVPSKFAPYASFEPRGEVYELVVLDGWPSKVVSNRADGAYTTKDLFVPHPSRPGLWKYYARLDDTIVLVNGEKVNPVHMEHAIRQHSLVREAVIVGTNKPRLGLLVIPSEAAKDFSSEQLIDKLVPAINKANEGQDDFGKITPDMILVLPSDTEYPRTDKGTVIRAAFNRDFATKIEDLYTTKAAGYGGLILDEPELCQYLSKLVSKTLGLTKQISIKDDFFSLGMDSLQALTVRAQILRDLDTGRSQIGLNIVFDYPTTESLARALQSARVTGSTVASSIEDNMKYMTEQFSVFQRHNCSINSAPQTEHIVLTGATGSLGAHILYLLVTMPNVSKVYCLVRARSPTDAFNRVVRSLAQRRLHRIISTSLVDKIITLPSDLAKPDFGIGDYYNIVVQTATKIIHAAWPVNFNMALQSYESALAGLHNLIQLGLDSPYTDPASFYFISSVSVASNTPGGYIKEQVDHDYSHAQGMGYAQSKMVAENLCSKARAEYGALSRVLRVGQICGDTKCGVWNPAEAIPLIFQSALTIGAIPALEENDRWLPADTVAKTVIDLAFADGESKMDPDALFHVVNPKTFHWSRDMIPLLADTGLKFDVVPPAEWVHRLQRSNSDPVENPPIKLADFFASKYEHASGREAFFDTANSCKFSPTLREAPVVNSELVSKMVSYWTSYAWTRCPRVVYIERSLGAIDDFYLKLTKQVSGKVEKIITASPQDALDAIRTTPTGTEWAIVEMPLLSEAFQVLRAQSRCVFVTNDISSSETSDIILAGSIDIAVVCEAVVGIFL
ncbi:NRPS-like enzyme [Dipodascopsis uninucleata]